ncbi:MFS transporter [Roseicitreum antarcticum]|uniref:Predicted arabinose efflux permease, MFS family n=1 Tax=Roseicitreum antarcticum TaxID=564137 RepID=A0A1H3A908_9RHOB|nr:MFS transporter [Roseicitreum antarcticum]SDX25359.1 Predicted arabinose efflux permease, MFS family [Roseicitreum antarcticum]
MPPTPTHPAAGTAAWPVWALAVGQTLGYAAFAYIFAALILSWEGDLGWSKTTFALGPMVSVALSAVLAPLAGRMVDRGLGVYMLTFGAALGGVALIGLSQVTTPAHYIAAWVVIGLAHAACLYDVCFAFLIRRFGAQARPRIVRVTLVAGFASTIAFPTGAALAGALGWRGAVLVAAGAVLCVMVPLHFLAARAIRAGTPQPSAASLAEGRAAPAIALRRPAFWGLAALFASLSLNHWMLVAFMVPLLSAQGVALTWAVTAASSVGVAQTIGRLVLFRYDGRIGTRGTALIVTGAQVVAALMLLAVGLSPVVVLAFALLQGAALGIMTILRPVMVAETLGQAGFGAINGMLSIPAQGAMAVAPLFAALLFDGIGPMALIAAAFAAALLALGLALALTRRHGENTV